MAGILPFGFGRMVPCAGRKLSDALVLSRRVLASSVSVVSANGFQVSDGAIIRRWSLNGPSGRLPSRARAVRRYDSLPSASSAPAKSPATCLRAWLPYCTSISWMGSVVGCLVTMLTVPPGSPWPYSTEAGPRSSSTRSICHGSTRQLARLMVLGNCRPSRLVAGMKPRTAVYQSERVPAP